MQFLDDSRTSYAFDPYSGAHVVFERADRRLLSGVGDRYRPASIRSSTNVSPDSSLADGLPQVAGGPVVVAAQATKTAPRISTALGTTSSSCAQEHHATIASAAAFEAQSDVAGRAAESPGEQEADPSWWWWGPAPGVPTSYYHSATRWYAYDDRRSHYHAQNYPYPRQRISSEPVHPPYSSPPSFPISHSQQQASMMSDPPPPQQLGHHSKFGVPPTTGASSSSTQDAAAGAPPCYAYYFTGCDESVVGAPGRPLYGQHDSDLTGGHYHYQGSTQQPPTAWVPQPARPDHHHVDGWTPSSSNAGHTGIVGTTGEHEWRTATAGGAPITTTNPLLSSHGSNRSAATTAAAVIDGEETALSSFASSPVKAPRPPPYTLACVSRGVHSTPAMLLEASASTIPSVDSSTLLSIDDAMSDCSSEASAGHGASTSHVAVFGSTPSADQQNLKFEPSSRSRACQLADDVLNQLPRGAFSVRGWSHHRLSSLCSASRSTTPPHEEEFNPRVVPITRPLGLLSEHDIRLRCADLLRSQPRLPVASYPVSLLVDFGFRVKVSVRSTCPYVVGTKLLVEGDNGVDLCIVKQCFIDPYPFRADTTAIVNSTTGRATTTSGASPSNDLTSSPPAGWFARVLRKASPEEIAFHDHVILPRAAQCLQFVRRLKQRQCGTRVDLMEFLGSEAQLDGEKIVVYYRSTSSVRFVDLARLLHREYRCRVWIIQLNRRSPIAAPLPAQVIGAGAAEAARAAPRVDRVQPSTTSQQQKRHQQPMHAATVANRNSRGKVAGQH